MAIDIYRLGYCDRCGREVADGDMWHYYDVKMQGHDSRFECKGVTIQGQDRTFEDGFVICGYCISDLEKWLTNCEKINTEQKPRQIVVRRLRHNNDGTVDWVEETTTV